MCKVTLFLGTILGIFLFKKMQELFWALLKHSIENFFLGGGALLSTICDTALFLAFLSTF